MQESELMAALQNPEVFKRSFATTDDLERAVTEFPQHRENLIHSLLNNFDEFKRLLPNNKTLRGATTLFPHVIHFVLNNPQEFKRLFTSKFDFWWTIEKFPHNGKMLLDYLFNTPSEFQRFIPNNHILRATAAAYPEYAQILINHVMNHPEELKRLFATAYDLDNTLQEIPLHSEVIIYSLLKKPEEFTRLFSNGDTLYYTSEKLSCFIEHATTNPTAFKRLIANTKDFHLILKLLPQYTEKLMNYIMNNPAEFKRLFPNNAELNETKTLFPEYANRLTQQKDSLKNLIEMQKNALMLKQAKRTEHAFFEAMPNETIANIVTYTSNFSLLSKDDSFKEASSLMAQK
ncbi:hypothetical protein [Legionella clemsonensis]|uniref:Uncharacterized protein n=1 Tax=Legionella clemsonensis TaxID=1867846 RepID=A0A222NZ21_9GAMM|nr:hypothetical protein [Legionella clemsonensis]ASQ44844.1 hypothetical protein clem_01390 [Legionella clemsonensis]